MAEKQNADAKFIKYILSNSSDNKYLISRLKKRKIDFYNAKSFNFFDKETVCWVKLKELIVLENGFIIIASPGKSNAR